MKKYLNVKIVYFGTLLVLTDLVVLYFQALITKK